MVTAFYEQKRLIYTPKDWQNDRKPKNKHPALWLLPLYKGSMAAFVYLTNL